MSYVRFAFLSSKVGGGKCLRWQSLANAIYGVSVILIGRKIDLIFNNTSHRHYRPLTHHTVGSQRLCNSIIIAIINHFSLKFCIMIRKQTLHNS